MQVLVVICSWILKNIYVNMIFNLRSSLYKILNWISEYEKSFLIFALQVYNFSRKLLGKNRVKLDGTSDHDLDIRSKSLAKVIDVEVSAFSEQFLFFLIFSGVVIVITPPRNCGEVIFSLQFVCVCVCVCVCLSVQLCLWTKFQPNQWTDLDNEGHRWRSKVTIMN